ncbi:MAG: hypothetical protein HFJ46_07110 [Clostridia bacterium]|nr:hypothetical protein [Clostridia bacterium]
MTDFESKYLRGEPHEVADYIYDFLEECTVISVMGDIDGVYCQKLASAVEAKVITIEDMVSGKFQKPEKNSLIVLKLCSKKYQNNPKYLKMIHFLKYSFRYLLYGVKGADRGGVRALKDGIIIGGYEAEGKISVDVLGRELEESNLLEIGMFFGNMKVRYVSINKTIFVQVDEREEQKTNPTIMALKRLVLQTADKNVSFCSSMQEVVKRISEER